MSEKQDKQEKTEDVKLPIAKLVPFHKHPFKVMADYQMVELKESIRACGILTPLIVRELEDGNYEIISGHRRKHAAEQLGLEEVPAIIRQVDTLDAIVEMVDSNLYRESILPSEKAFAYKMKYHAMLAANEMKRQPFRDENGEPIYGRTIEVMGRIMGESPKQVQRYIKITNLIPELLKKLDDGIISFNPAVEIAYMRPADQKKLLDAMDYAQASPSLSQAQRMKRLSQARKLTPEILQIMMSEVKKGELERVTFKTCQLRKYFPKDWSTDQMKQEILSIIREHVEEHFEKGKEGESNV